MWVEVVDYEWIMVRCIDIVGEDGIICMMLLVNILLLIIDGI